MVLCGDQCLPFAAVAIEGVTRLHKKALSDQLPTPDHLRCIWYRLRYVRIIRCVEVGHKRPAQVGKTKTWKKAANLPNIQLQFASAQMSIVFAIQGPKFTVPGIRWQCRYTI